MTIRSEQLRTGRVWVRSAAPTANDDDLDGYLAGDFWVDTTNKKSYQLYVATTGAAEWVDFVTASTLTQEQVEDFVGAMFTGNITTNVDTTYDDVNGKIALEVTDYWSSPTFGELGVAPETPSSGDWKLYFMDNGLFIIHDSGTAIGPLGTVNGWYPYADTWTRTGNHTFTTGGDRTATFRQGTKIRYKDGGAYEYGFVASSSHAGGTTTVNLIPNSDYAMAAATLTDTYISYIENPEAFPHWINYTPIYSRSGTAFTNSPTTNVAHFRTMGNMLLGYIDFTMPASAGGSGEVYASVPQTIVTDRTDFGVETTATVAFVVAMAMSSINKLSFFTTPVAVISTTAGYRYRINFKYLF